MGQQQSAPYHRPGPSTARRVDWWEALKLGAITAAVGALQWFKFALLTYEDGHTENRRHHHGRRSNEQERNQLKEGLGALSPETRRALAFMIDQQLTPILVDQWRLGLAKAFLPEEVALPEEDPQLRQALLDSLKTYQDAQDRRPTFRQPPANTPLPQRRAQAPPRQRASPATQPGPVRPSVAAGASRTRGSEVISEMPAAATSAAPTAPSFSPTSPSAPPMPPGLADEAGPSSSATGMAEPEEVIDDCGICMDHKVEVQVAGCHHKLCIECARAICCLEGRAPQCPFCRGPIYGVEQMVI